MGTKTTLAAITLTTAGAAKAEAIGLDVAGYLAETQQALAEVVNKLQFLVTDVLTPAGSESSNITAINTLITNLS